MVGKLISHTSEQTGQKAEAKIGVILALRRILVQHSLSYCSIRLYSFGATQP